MGCFPLYQNFRKFRSKNKWDALVCVEISGQNGPPPEVVLFDGWSGLTETSRSISKNFRFQSYPAISSNQNFGRNANGSFRFD